MKAKARKQYEESSIGRNLVSITDTHVRPCTNIIRLQIQCLGIRDRTRNISFKLKMIDLRKEIRKLDFRVQACMKEMKGCNARRKSNRLYTYPHKIRANFTNLP